MAKIPIIKNSWKNTSLQCEKCGQKMELTQIKNTFSYECPSCKLSVTANTFEKILDTIAKLVEERFETNGVYSIEGETFKIGILKFTIIYESESYNEWIVAVK